ERRERQRGVNQQRRPRLVAQAYGQGHRREHYRRDQLSVDHLLPKDEDRDESQNGHQRSQPIRQSQRDRQREVIARHDATHKFLHRVVILVKEWEERGERGRDQQIVSVAGRQDQRARQRVMPGEDQPYRRRIAQPFSQPARFDQRQIGHQVSVVDRGRQN